MAENGSELRRVVWTEAFPFVRLFESLRLALNAGRLLLALAAVIGLYFGGRILDLVWWRHGAVVGLYDGVLATEIEVYSRSHHGEFAAWLDQAKADRAAALERAAPEPNEIAWETQLDELRAAVDEQLREARAALEAERGLARERRDERRRNLAEAADALRAALDEDVPQRVARARIEDAIDALFYVQAPVTTQRIQLQQDLLAAAARQARVRLAEALEPRGVFISLLDFETVCFAAAIQGVCNGRWGVSGGALDPQPALVGSVISAGRGLLWLFNQRPLYGLLFGLFSLAVLAYFGGAICRSAAMQSARDEPVAMRAGLRFVQERYGGFLVAPLLPIGVVLVIWLIMAVGGLIGGIPFLGELITGPLYFLGLFGGFAAAMVLLALLIGIHVMWPTIAVEGSDGFDALSRAASYVSSRIFHVAFYVLTLLVYGALAFVLLRWIVALALKLAHKFTGSTMNLFAAGEVDLAGKLDAMWLMPAWADLPFLPSRDVPTVGWFYNAPLNGTEVFCTWFLALWVYLFFSLLAAFAVSFYFCGATQMYFLLRRSVDATDYDEVYYEGPEEELPPFDTTPAGSTAESGAPPPETERPSADTEPPPATPPGGAI